MQTLICGVLAELSRGAELCGSFTDTSLPSAPVSRLASRSTRRRLLAGARSGGGRFPRSARSRARGLLGSRGRTEAAGPGRQRRRRTCLLYTSDAADALPCVDLG